MDFLDDIASILDVKGHGVFTISPDATVFAAIRTMADREIGALMVVDELGDLVGIVSERDYTRKVILRGRSSRETLVREIMTSPVVTVDPTCTVEEGLRMMTRRRVRHLPVVNDEALLGVVSIGDLVKRLISDQRAALTQLEGYVIGRYPG